MYKNVCLFYKKVCFECLKIGNIISTFFVVMNVLEIHIKINSCNVGYTFVAYRFRIACSLHFIKP